nr:reverse transcriptase domain-containing protein [Tanacetum cinerariifolium]
MISKDGIISEFPGYTSSKGEEDDKEEEEEEKELSEKKGSKVQARGREAAIGMSWVDFKALLVERFYPISKIEKLESELWNHTMIGANHVGYTDRFHELAKLVPYSSAILKVVILTDEAIRYGTLTRSSKKRKDCRAPVRHVAPVSVVRMENNQRVCYEYGSSDHPQNTCPKLNRVPGQVGNHLALEGNQNTRNNGNQARGRAFSVNAVNALIDLIPLSHRSFDVIVGMDWLFKNKVEIVCHEKVVRIPLESGEILRVQRGTYFRRHENTNEHEGRGTRVE